MDTGRKICDVLKTIRKQIAEMNDIVYEPKVCHYKGHCHGSCPACEAEREYIESELSFRKSMGMKICVTGVALGMLTSPYNVNAQSHLDTPVNSTFFNKQKSSDNDNIPQDSVLIKGCVKDMLGIPICEAPVITPDGRYLTSTDIEGNFSIYIPHDSPLTVRYVGYETKNYSFGDLDLSGTNVLYLPKAEGVLLGEVVVVRKKNVRKEIRRIGRIRRREIKYNKRKGKASFPGGDTALQMYLANNTHLAEIAQNESNVPAQVRVSFYVLGDGSLADVKVLNQCPLRIKEEVLRLVKSMPKWKPATDSSGYIVADLVELSIKVKGSK
ncbi:MAG: hypothetical protein K5874_01410 [Bacteroidaceae bacterium]|nr:hypothetical protein [Bacteroidaceae bacterium]